MTEPQTIVRHSRAGLRYEKASARSIGAMTASILAVAAGQRLIVRNNFDASDHQLVADAVHMHAFGRYCFAIILAAAPFIAGRTAVTSAGYPTVMRIGRMIEQYGNQRGQCKSGR